MRQVKEEVKKAVEDMFGLEFGPFNVGVEEEWNYKGEIYQTGCYLIHFYTKDLIIRMGPFMENFTIRRLGHFSADQAKDLMRTALTLRKN